MSRFREISQDGENKKIVYKLLGDGLILGLVFFALALIAETLLPGIVTSHVGFSKIILGLAVIFIALGYLGQTLDFATPPVDQPTSKKSAMALSFLGALIVAASLLKFGLLYGTVIFLLVIAAGYFIYKNIFE